MGYENQQFMYNGNQTKSILYSITKSKYCVAVSLQILFPYRQENVRFY